MVNFFRWYSQIENIEEYRKNMENSIFFLIQKFQLSPESIAIMPVKRFENLIEWKVKLDSEKGSELGSLLENIMGVMR